MRFFGAVRKQKHTKRKTKMDWPSDLNVDFKFPPPSSTTDQAGPVAHRESEDRDLLARLLGDVPTPDPGLVFHGATPTSDHVKELSVGRHLGHQLDLGMDMPEWGCDVSPCPKSGNGEAVFWRFVPTVGLMLDRTSVDASPTTPQAGPAAPPRHRSLPRHDPERNAPLPGWDPRKLP